MPAARPSAASQALKPVEPGPVAARETPRVENGALLTKSQTEFVKGLAAPVSLPAPEDLTHDDILFLEGLIRRLEAAQLEVAMLPQATLRLTGMLRRGDVPVAQYSELINKDTSLSMEVLKAANSAFYGGSARTTGLDEAIMRIGLTRLQGILMLALMRSRVLKAGTLRAHAEVLMDMALPLGSCAAALARATGGPADLCFMRGMLLHVEHLVILGTLSETSKEHRAVITPTTGALLLALDRSGRETRHALAHGWSLEDILIGRENDDDCTDYAALRAAVVARWLRHPLPEVPGISPQLLERIMAPVAPRVPEPEPELQEEVVGD
jgi:hypothetical protein